MDVEILRLAAAPTTRGLVRDLAERLADVSPATLAVIAFQDGELRAALNLALAGAISGRPPTAAFATALSPSIENSDLAVAFLATVRRGLVDALAESAKTGQHSPDRQGMILWLAAVRLDGREPPDELKTRIRLTARQDLTETAKYLVGLAALAVDDPDVLAVARDCVAAADTPTGRAFDRQCRKHLRTPVLDHLPDEPAPELHGGFTLRRTDRRVGRNDPCPCGSGKKYKRCCLDRRADSGPAPDHGQAWGGRYRHHRSMTDRQFADLLPLEILHIPPEDLSTPRLFTVLAKFTQQRYVEESFPYLDEAVTRTDLPEGATADDLRLDVLRAAIVVDDANLAERILSRLDDREAVPLELEIGIAMVGGHTEALDCVEDMADAVLRAEGDSDLHGRLLGSLAFFTPALGILTARGAIDVDDPEGMEDDLRMIEEARDILNLPPHDPAWEIYDAVSERTLEARAERSAVEENEELLAELEEVRRSLAISGAVERDARHELERQRRLVDDLAAALMRAKDSNRGAEDAAEALENARRELGRTRTQIEEGNEKRRQLRKHIRQVSARLEATLAEEAEEGDGEDLEEEARDVPERLRPRIPVFTKEFRDGLKDAADPLSRAAIAMACRLAAGDAGAWSGVKSIKALPGVFSRRMGRRRLLFRLVGEDGVEMLRVLHRRDLETVIRRIGGC